MNVNNFLKQVREGYSPSKSEEKDFITRLYVAFSEHPQNTYLSGLFTAELSNFAIWAINADMPADYKAEVDAKLNRVRAERDGIQAALDTAKAENAKKDKRIAELEAQIARTEKQANSYAVTCAHLRSELTRESARYLAGLTLSDNVINLATSAWQDANPIAPEDLRELYKSYQDRLVDAPHPDPSTYEHAYPLYTIEEDK